MTTQFRALGMLFVGTALLVLAQGLMLALVPLNMNAQGASAQAVGLIGSAYFAGVLIGAWDGTRIIHAVGYIRAYGGLIALIIVTALTLPLLPGTVSWTALRFLHGLAAGGAFLAIEAWLNAASEAPWRGRVLAVYTLISLGALGVGQFLMAAMPIDGLMPFVIGGIIYAAGIIPVMLTRIDAPATVKSERKSFKELYRYSPFGVVAAFVTGLGMGAYWGLGPYFGARIGFSVEQVSLLMAVAVFSGLVMQWPAGYLSDRFDRRRVVLVLAAACAAAGAAGIFVNSAAVHYACFGVLGAMFCLYPISVSHALDHVTRREDTLEVSRGLLMAVGSGQMLGPVLAGQFMVFLGSAGLPVFFCAVFGGIAVFTAWRMARRAPAPPEQHEKFVAVRTSTPAGAVLDPRVRE